MLKYAREYEFVHFQPTGKGFKMMISERTSIASNFIIRLPKEDEQQPSCSPKPLKPKYGFSKEALVH